MKNKVFKSEKELIPFIKSMADSGKKVKLTVTGNSMFPLFSHERDIVQIAKAPVYRKYDIIFYIRDNGDPVLHRIVKKKPDVYYLCGDNQLDIEYPIYENQIIGKVESFIRKKKEISVSNLFYIIYTRVWCISIKSRKILMTIAVKLRRMFK